MGPGVVGGGHGAEVGAVGPLGLDGLLGGIDLDEGLVLVEVLVQLVQLVVGVVVIQGGVDGDLNAADLGQQMGLEVDVLPGLGLHQILAGEVGDVLLDLRGVAVAAAQGVGAEVVLGFGQDLVLGGTASGAGEAALGVHDDGIFHNVTGLQQGLQGDGGGGGIAAGVGDEALALGELAHDLGDAVDGVMGHLGIGMDLTVPLLPDLRVAETDVRADVDDLLAGGKDDLGPLGHGAGGDLDEDHVALGGGGPDVLLVDVEDGLVVEAAEVGVVDADLIADAVGVEDVDQLALGVGHHHAEQLAADVAHGADD